MRKLKRRIIRTIYILLFISSCFIITIATLSLISDLKQEAYQIQPLDANYPKQSEVDQILLNADPYPEELIEALKKNHELYDFVKDYPTKHDLPVELELPSYDGIPHFMQWDERWGYQIYGDTYMALSGCGPTTLAMVISGLTHEMINPYTVAQFAMENGYYEVGIGSSWLLMTIGATDFGLTSEEIPNIKETIREHLSNGELIIAAMGPGDFTSSGHFIVITDIDEDGNLIVLDSYRVSNSKNWRYEDIQYQIQNLWAFSYSSDIMN